MANITFEDYYVDEMSYIENEEFDNDNSNKLEMDTFPKANVYINEDLALILFEITVGDFENAKCPFVCKLNIKAFFKYTVSDTEEDIEELKILLTQNTIAILYPYVRSIISDLTLRSNKFPAFVLPTINVVKLMQDNDAIQLFNIEQVVTTSEDE